MSNMKCPICGSKMSVSYGSGEELFSCSNLACKAYYFFATDDTWQELARTRKVLELAVDVLKEINELLSSNRFDIKETPLLNITQTKISMLLKCINIERITAEQKDIK